MKHPLHAKILILLSLATLAAPSRAATEIQDGDIIKPGPGITAFDVPTGTFGKPGQVSEISRYKDGRLLYRVTVSTDAYGRRITPQPDVRKEKSMLFFGNSVIFGDSLSDEQTFPALFAKKAPGVKVYNYAFQAHGPHHFYVHSLYRKFEGDEIQPRTGWIAYVLFNYDLNRLVNDSRSASYSGLAPSLYLDANDRLHHEGSFQSAHPVTTWFYGWIQKQWAVRKWNELFPMHEIYFPKIGPEHVRLLCRVFEEARENFRRSLPGMEFLVILHPRGGGVPYEVAQCLNERKIRVLDYRLLYDGIPLQRLLGADEDHLKPEAHEMVLKPLVRDLGLESSPPNPR